ncbi:MAG: methyltransferase domain-containing protein [Nitrospinae bacterium]|nr:methyltransferase domain-containing protein [Nitrospinota bacterium]
MISTGKVKRSFAKSAKNYSVHSSLQNDVSSVLVREFAPKSATGKILDIGCGSGFTGLAGAAKWPSAQITGVDLARGMAAEARRNGVKKVVAGDAALLPFKAGAFDGALSSLAFQWIIGGRDGLFDGIFRALRHGGFLSFSMMAGETLAELRKAYDEACVQCTGKKASFPSFPDESKTAEMIKEAGFSILRSESRKILRGYKNVDGLFATLKGLGASAPARPANPPRRDVLQKTRTLYPTNDGTITATYEIIYFWCVRG